MAPALKAVRLQSAFPNVKGAFGSRPLFVTQIPDGSNLFAVVAQDGRIFTAASADATATVFLNISSRVSTDNNEEGLLGLAFHPLYAQNGRFFVYYAVAGGARRTRLSEFHVTAGKVDTGTGAEKIVLEPAKPFGNHKGGGLMFGPDGYLYVGLGDGGSGGDPMRNGQNLSVLLGKILRIDINSSSADRPYGIPPDNPFTGATAPAGARAEIFTYGMRNPWRFSFDRSTGALWIGDVGQNLREEIDFGVKGGNYGWNIMEGFACYSPSSACNQSGLILPVFDYPHDQGCSITGGYVYRGSAIPWLQGAYLYSDFCSGRIWALRYDGAKVTEQKQLAATGLGVSSFGQDAAGELYVTAFDGNVYKIVDAP